MNTVWEESGLLDGLTEYQKDVLSILYENQYHYNQSIGIHASINALSVSLIRKLFDPVKFILWDIIFIRPLLQPSSIIPYQKNNEGIYQVGHFNVNNFDSAAETYTSAIALVKEFKTPWFCNPFITLEYEAEKALEVVEKVREELIRGIVEDLRSLAPKNSGVTLYMKPDAANVNSEQIIGHLSNKIGCRWIIGNPQSIKAIIPYASYLYHADYDVNKICLAAKVNNVSIFNDPLFPENTLLAGASQPIDSPYVYCPYIPFIKIATTVDELVQPSNYFVKTRHAKAVFPNMNDFYTIIKLKEWNENVNNEEEIA